MKSLSWDNQRLKFAQIPILELVKKYQTPLFVYDQDEILSRINTLKRVCREYEDRMTIYYASKAFLTLAMAQMIKDSEIGIDVASRGELFIALKGHIDPTKILYHGNNKSLEDISYAINRGVRKFVVDNMNELILIKDISDDLAVELSVLIRVIPKVSNINTHKNITTGHHRSKFGIDMDLDFDRVFTFLPTAKHIHFKGFHVHVGSQLLSNESHLKAIDQLFVYIKKLKEMYQISIEEINMGGGFGIKYLETDQPMTIQTFLDSIMQKIKTSAHTIHIPVPHVSIEPGRFIVGGTAIILYTVGSIKQGSPYPIAAINGGMTENLRVALYQANYQALLVDRKNQMEECYTIVGQACESTDVMIEQAKLPKLQKGDTIAFLNAGAYEHSLVNNFNKTLKPAVIMIHQGVDRVIQKRETYEDLISRDDV